MQSLLLTGLNMRTILKNAKQVTVATLVPSHQLFFSCWLSKSRFSALSVTAIKKTTYTYIVRVVQNIWSATRRAFLFKQQPYPPSTKTLEPKFFSSCTRKWNVLQNERAQSGMCSIRIVLNMASAQTGMCSKIRQFIIYYAQSLVCLSKRTTDQASDVPSIIFFIISYRLRALKIVYFYYQKF